MCEVRDKVQLTSPVVSQEIKTQSCLLLNSWGMAWQHLHLRSVLDRGLSVKSSQQPFCPGFQEEKVAPGA